ncbi:low molecular weight protein-tyrosine-phosphatase [Larkinella rosea]|uniref:protein-tyrosine-phosphatase n=1 Tax=Larkinella rosea TaxID=2025312 RepID=A0A3P1BDB0_9BACT|nr:low molecular weight protein-tyrosine-phosphatase [Larkinella rosea]RRA99090.1 low molecular weight phosphotyrosine protein phosphatase [Larkinella rosea]
MINVLFVCLGNICRSPVAEGVFWQLVKERGLETAIRCDSAGTSSYHIGDLPDRRTRENALEHGITLTHRARKLSGEDLSQFDYLVAMDEANYDAIQYFSHRSTGLYSEENTVLLREFDPQPDTNPGGLSVPDPYYEDAAVFEQVYQIVNRCCDNLLNYLVEQHQLQPQSEHRANG